VDWSCSLRSYALHKKHGNLSLNKYGCSPKRDTHAANIQLLNTLETAWDDDAPWI